jgi:nitrilase
MITSSDRHEESETRAADERETCKDDETGELSETEEKKPGHPEDGFCLALCQPQVRDRVAENLSRCAVLIDEAVKRKAQLIVLPENFAFMGPERQRVVHGEAVADATDGPIMAWARKQARKAGSWLLLGGIPERTALEKVYTTAVLLDDQGALRARYRKIHLFDVELEDGPVVRESDAVVAGERVVDAETPWARLGLSICYDLRFPELYRTLAARGAQLLCVPAAFTDVTGKAHWQVLLRARAVENLCFVAAANLTGVHFENRISYGHSMIVDPWGRILATLEEDEGVCSAEIKVSEVTRRRNVLPALTHRRLGLAAPPPPDSD